MRTLKRRCQLELLESRENPSPAQVTSVLVNGFDMNLHGYQRSRVTTLRVNFNEPVTIADVGQAFQLERVPNNDAVILNTVLDSSGTFASMTFTGGAVDGAVGNRSLADGRYVLTVVAGQFTGDGFDGNGDGIAGDDYHSPSSPSMQGPPYVPPTGIFRLFGDIGGIGQVDFLAFRLNYWQVDDALDFDGNGIVDPYDFLQFRLRIGVSI